MKAINSLLFVFLISSLAFSQSIDITKVDVENDITPNDIIYALPTTRLIGTISGEEQIYLVRKKNVEKITVFTDKGMLKVTKNPVTSQEHVLITKNLSIDTKAIPDKNHIYKVGLRKKWNKHNKLSLKIAKNGLIESGSFVSEDKTFEIIASSISTLIGTFKASSDNDIEKLYNSEKDAAKFFKSLNLEDIKLLPTSFNSPSDTIIKNLRAQITKREDIKTQIKNLNQKLKTLENSFIYNNVYDTNINALKFKISTLNKLITEQKTLLGITKSNFVKTLNSFMGTFKVNDRSFNYEFPVNFDHKVFTKKELYYEVTYKHPDFEFKLSNKTTYEDEDANAERKCKNCIYVVIDRGTNDFGKNFYEKLKNEPSNTGLPYKIPASYELTFQTNQNSSSNPMSFFAVGNAYGRLSSKTNLNTIVFHPKLGSIQEISAESKAISATDIASIGKSITDTKNAIKGKTETEKLKEETDLLTLKVLKNTLKKQLEEIEKESEDEDID